MMSGSMIRLKMVSTRMFGLLLLATAFPACVQREVGFLDADRLGPHRDAPITVEIPVAPDMTVLIDRLNTNGGGMVQVGNVDGPMGWPLRQAWESGSVPSYQIHGQKGGVWARAVGLQANGTQVEAVARAIHPRPFQLRLLADEGPLKATGSEQWGEGLYYAEVVMNLKDNRLTGFRTLAAEVTEDREEEDDRPPLQATTTAFYRTRVY